MIVATLTNLAAASALFAATSAATVIASTFVIYFATFPRIKWTTNGSPAPGTCAAIIAVSIAPAFLGTARVLRTVPALALFQRQDICLSNCRMFVVRANSVGVDANRHFEDSKITADCLSLSIRDVSASECGCQRSCLKKDGNYELHIEEKGEVKCQGFGFDCNVRKKGDESFS